MLRRADFKDVHSRVVVQYPESKEPIPEEKKMEQLPEKMMEFFKEWPDSVWKIEWMYRGGFITAKSDIYSNRYGPSLTSRKDLYTKIVDTMGFSKWEMGYKMWVETIRTPGQVVKYEGLAYHLDKKKTGFQTARMMTIVLDYQHIITVTLIV